MTEFDEVPAIRAAKRLGVQRCPWMGDWFTSWSPRNSNNNAEGSWAEWAHMAAQILSHPATRLAAPELYRPELKEASSSAGLCELREDQISEVFKDRV